MRQIFGEIRWEVKGLIFLGLVFSFSLFGPFGTYLEMNFGERFAFWTAVMAGVAFFIHIAVHTALTTPLLARLRPVLRVLLGVAIGSAPAAGMVAFLDRAFRGANIDVGSLMTLYWQIGVIAAVIAPLEYLQLRATGATVPAPRSRLHDRLDADMGDDIVSLSMQDHYVEVTTDAGRQLILMRLSDAMEELHPIQGVRLHRSHWAASRHIDRLDKDGARHVVHLKDGRSLPVSGTYLDDVQKALAPPR